MGRRQYCYLVVFDNGFCGGVVILHRKTSFAGQRHRGRYNHIWLAFKSEFGGTRNGFICVCDATVGIDDFIDFSGS